MFIYFECPQSFLLLLLRSTLSFGLCNSLLLHLLGNAIANAVLLFLEIVGHLPFLYLLLEDVLEVPCSRTHAVLTHFSDLFLAELDLFGWRGRAGLLCWCLASSDVAQRKGNYASYKPHVIFK